MTITVRSNDEAPAEKPVAASTEQEKSAPEAKASEQNESPESETEETEESVSDQDESDLEGETEESKDAEKERPKKKGGFQRRIDKLNARYSAVQAEVEHWKSMALKQGAGEPKADKTVETTKNVSQEGKPNPDTFDTHSEYVEALTDWKTEQKFKEREQKAEKSKLLSEHEQVLKSHSERVKSFMEKTDNFSEVLESVDDIPVSATVQEIIISSDNGPELMFELAKNRDEYARICKLAPLAAARELGKIESRLSAKSSDEKKPEAKKLTNAPKPIEPIGGSKGKVSKSLDDPNLSQSEYERLRRDQIKRKQA